MDPAAESLVKIMAIGDGCVGKTGLLVSYCTHVFPTDYVGTVFDNYVTHIDQKIDGIRRKVKLSLWDTSGVEEYDRLRPLAYPNTDIFLIVGSVVSSWSFDNIEEKWIKEARHHCPLTPVILVGNKTDLRTDETTVKELAAKKQKPVTYKEGVAMAKMIGAKKYIECSAKTRHNLKEVFEEALQEHFKGKEKKNICASFSISCLKGRQDDQFRIGSNSIG